MSIKSDDDKVVDDEALIENLGINVLVYETLDVLEVLEVLLELLRTLTVWVVVTLGCVDCEVELREFHDQTVHLTRRPVRSGSRKSSWTARTGRYRWTRLTRLRPMWRRWWSWTGSLTSR